MHLLLLISLLVVATEAGYSAITELHKTHHKEEKQLPTQHTQHQSSVGDNVEKRGSKGTDRLNNGEVFPTVTSARNKNQNGPKGSTSSSSLVNKRSAVKKHDPKRGKINHKEGECSPKTYEAYEEYKDLLASTQSEYKTALSKTTTTKSVDGVDTTVLTLQFPPKTEKAHKNYKYACTMVSGTYMRLGDEFNHTCSRSSTDETGKNQQEEVFVTIQNYAYCNVDKPPEEVTSTTATATATSTTTAKVDCKNKISIQQTLQEEIFEEYGLHDCVRVIASSDSSYSGLKGQSKFSPIPNVEQHQHGPVTVSNSDRTKNVTVTAKANNEGPPEKVLGHDGEMDANSVHHYNAADHKVTGKEKVSIGKGGDGGVVVGGGVPVHHFNAADHKVTKVGDDTSPKNAKDKETTAGGQQQATGNNNMKEESTTNMVLVVFFVAISTLLCSVISGIILRKLCETTCTGFSLGGSGDKLGKYERVATLNNTGGMVTDEEDDSLLGMGEFKDNKHRFVDDEYGDVEDDDDDDDDDDEEEKKDDEKVIDV